MDYSDTYNQIKQLIEDHRGEKHFSLHDELRKHNLPHISYSQIKSIEFCPINYHFQYVQNIETQPTPAYFVKGKLLHEFIADVYTKLRDDREIDEVEPWFDDTELDPENTNHIRNAINLHLSNLWQGFDIIGIEDCFVLNIEASIPPVVGVIDLLLQDQEGTVTIVDHKTGHYFNEQDAFQMAVYHQYVQQAYNPANVEYFYDHYRWVNNLARIRKPAFNRERVVLPRGHEKKTVQRVMNAAEKIELVRSKKTIDRRWYADRGECFRCPFRTECYG